MITYKGLHGYDLVFLKSVPEMEILKGESFFESWDSPDEEADQEHYYFDTYNGHHKVKRSDEGVLYERHYFELRANWLATKYEPAPMNAYRLDRKRKHAIEEPDGRTAELMGHIDWLQAQLDEIKNLREHVLDQLVREAQEENMGYEKEGGE